MWRRARPVLLMTVRDLRRRPLRTILVAALLALVTAAGSVAVGMAVASRSPSAWSSVDPWVSATTLLVCVMAVGIICLVTAPIHMAAAHRGMRQIGLLGAAGGRGRDATLALVAPAGLTAVLGACVGAPIGMLLATASLQTAASGGALTVAVNLGVLAIAVFVVAVNVVAALATAWRIRGASVIDTLQARLPAPVIERPWLRIVLAVVFIALGGAVVSGGLRSTDLLLVGVGAVVTWIGLAVLLAVGVTSILERVRHGPYTLRFAVREGARHPMRVVPTTIASATMVALLVAAMAYVGSTHQAERDRYTPLGPEGSALLLPSNPDGTASLPTPEAVEMVSSLVAAAGPGGLAAPMLTPDDILVLSSGDESLVLTPTDEARLLGGHTMPNSLLATDELIEAWGYEAAVGDVLAAGGAVAEPGTLAGGSGAGVLGWQGREQELFVEEILPRGPATVLLPAAAETGLGMAVHPVAVLVVGLDASALEELAQAAQAEGWWLVLEQGPPALEHAPTQYALLAAAAVVVALILWIMGALAREEARSDVVTLEAVGARPAFARWVAAWQAGGAAVVAVLAGAPVGLLGTRLLMSVRDTTIYTGASSPLVIPWGPLLALLVVVPVVAGLGVAALQPRRPPLVRRLAD